MTFENVDLSNLLNAFAKFQDFRQHLDTEQNKAGAIQAFEYCFELTWKIMRRILVTRGRTANSPKEVFRLAALEGFITDPELWFDFLEKRNLTVHTYQEEEAEKVINIFPAYADSINSFLAKIGGDVVR